MTRKRQTGYLLFPLVELQLVIVIILVIAGIAVFFFVRKAVPQKRQAACLTNLMKIAGGADPKSLTCPSADATYAVTEKDGLELLVCPKPETHVAGHPFFARKKGESRFLQQPAALDAEEKDIRAGPERVEILSTWTSTTTAVLDGSSVVIETRTATWVFFAVLFAALAGIVLVGRHLLEEMEDEPGCLAGCSVAFLVFVVFMCGALTREVKATLGPDHSLKVDKTYLFRTWTRHSEWPDVRALAQTNDGVYVVHLTEEGEPQVDSAFELPGTGSLLIRPFVRVLSEPPVETNGGS